MKSADIRKAFLKFFATYDHEIVPSSSLLPGNDPSLLFTNAGMVQFKQYFLGEMSPPFPRATSVQGCVRAGGKHNDLENVGFTARHHTFFEMLGNFSFGDYFKEKAIAFAWEFITQVLKIDPDKLWVTVYKDDKESASFWLNKIGVPKNRISYCGEEDNFWAMGPTGPCGPCTEIFYDHGPTVKGGPPGSADANGDRYVEIWNIVFMESERLADGTIKPLPIQSVDTGMGLERIAAVMQGVHDNYQTDIFRTLSNHCHDILGIDKAYLGLDKNQTMAPPLKVILDHIRTTTFLIAEGIIPSNEGRGYVLRRIIRRALRYGHKLNVQWPFLYKLVPKVVDLMGEAYPYLLRQQTAIEKSLKIEEEAFSRTFAKGLQLIEYYLESNPSRELPGEILFTLHDTHGFPIDISRDIAKEKGIPVDIEGFEARMQSQREQSKSTSKFQSQTFQSTFDKVSEFTGYQEHVSKSLVTAILKGSESLPEISHKDKYGIILTKTPFYAESGGQVGDVGLLVSKEAEFKVEDTQYLGQAIVHHGYLMKGQLRVGDELEAKIDTRARDAIMLNHSATHLLHAALRQIIGEHVIQKGSFVDKDKLRFDFSHHQALTSDELNQIELLVNDKIRKNLKSTVQHLTIEEATQQGAIALFNEKYGNIVRVMSMGDFSKELCGGTHVSSSGQIGFFKIVSESAIANGIRRIEAITGDKAIQWVQTMLQIQQTLTEKLHAKPQEIVNKVEALIDKNKQLEKKVEALQSAISSVSVKELDNEAEQINNVKVLIKDFKDKDINSLRQMADTFKAKYPKALVVFISIANEKMFVVASMTKACIGLCPSPSELIALLGCKGGGRDDFAQGGGEIISNLEKQIFILKDKIKSTIINNSIN